MRLAPEVLPEPLPSHSHACTLHIPAGPNLDSDPQAELWTWPQTCLLLWQPGTCWTGVAVPCCPVHSWPPRSRRPTLKVQYKATNPPSKEINSFQEPAFYSRAQVQAAARTNDCPDGKVGKVKKIQECLPWKLCVPPSFFSNVPESIKCLQHTLLHTFQILPILKHIIRGCIRGFVPKKKDVNTILCCISLEWMAYPF